MLLALALSETETGSSGTLSAGWQAVADLAEKLTLSMPGFAAGLRAEVALVQRDYPTAKTEAERALQSGDQANQGFYQLSLGRSLLGLSQVKLGTQTLQWVKEAVLPESDPEVLIPLAIKTLEQARAAVLPEVDPDLHIRILRVLHRALTQAGDYRQAFAVKCDREVVETQYGLRAFIGANRLQPLRRVSVSDTDPTKEFAASGRQEDIQALVERVKRDDCRLTIIHGPSGVGKSSLLQTGLVLALRSLIHRARTVVPVVVEQYENWQGELSRQLTGSGESASSESLIAALKGGSDRQITVLIFDQFEEFFFKHLDIPGRRQFYQFLRDCLDVPFVWVMLSLREDYIHYLLECDRLKLTLTVL